ncbi:MAG: HD-GYP domain-containing protein [Lachnospiraceae bacterium]|jgi:putative nucleotidyltransferase with HDIG domain
MEEAKPAEKRKHLIVCDLEQEIRHGIRVSQLARGLAEEAGLSQKVCYHVAQAGLLHDIGKLCLSNQMQGIDDPLIVEEMKYVRMHSRFSYEILKKRGYDPWLCQTVLYHHENYDGTGYPGNLEGEVIPVESRILRICDVYAALTEKRSYRDAFSHETAMELMIDEVRYFDMHLFLLFQRMLHKKEETGKEQ